MSATSSTDMENMTVDELRHALACERALRLGAEARAERAEARAETVLAHERGLRLSAEARAERAEARVELLERECIELNMTIQELRDQVSRALGTVARARYVPFRTCREEMLLYSGDA
jgi:TATA-binding protein-associated factor Taf7